jgi:DNA ligase (NAD+)
MLSIQDVFNKEDVLEWVHRVREIHPDAVFCVEQKIDGLSMTLRYTDGKLTLAETRGDGMIGEDVTVNARVIPDVRESIDTDSPYLEIRGEVYMSHADFDRTNEEQELQGRKTFANPRNCAAGTLRQLDPAMTKKRGLSLFIFNVQDGTPEFMESHSEGLGRLAQLGIKTAPSVPCRTDEEIISEIDRIGEMRGDLAYDIDGAVVKIDQIAYRNDFPAGVKYSAGHIAYKYPPEEKETVITDIEISIGMTGRVNPTAVFEPIRLCGTTVQRATLHNQDFINTLHIGIGDTVVVYKSGEIIPKIKSSVPEKRPAGVQDFRLPDVCPVCGGPIVQEEGMSDKKCINPNCPAQLERHLINFVGRSAMDIKGFGEENVLTLVREKLLSGIADIYTLKDHRQEMLDKKLIGLEKSTDKLLLAIENSKKNEPWRLLAGLAIENVGSTSARTIMRHFGSFEKLMQADRETLLSVKDVGPATAAAIVSFFSAEENRELMEKLREAGLTMAEEVKAAGSELAGKTFAVTGDVHKFKNRNELTAFIEDRGGKCAGSVSKKTFALINNDPGSMSGKNKKARELGIPIITEEEFLRALEEGEYNAN